MFFFKRHGFTLVSDSNTYIHIHTHTKGKKWHNVQCMAWIISCFTQAKKKEGGRKKKQEYYSKTFCCLSTGDTNQYQVESTKKKLLKFPLKKNVQEKRRNLLSKQFSNSKNKGFSFNFMSATGRQHGNKIPQNKIFPKQGV